ncbi:MAG TPA: VWA domain-containing protein, partial [Thermoanaerobaculia bacterium]|nr:VWA domain-containing protein [Thermoanaerobaculia bacterium]
MKLRSLLLWLLTSVFCVTASAQFSEVMEVRVTNVDVIVTKDGKPATGLTRDDFEIYENGVKKEISNFLEIRETSAAGTLTPQTPEAEAAAPAAAPTRPRSITVFVDNSVLSAARRNVVVPHLRTFLRDNVRPGDYVGIVVWAAGLKVVLDPTSDRARIDEGLDALAKWATVNIDRNAERENFYGSIRDLISLWASRVVPGGPGGGAPSDPPKPPWRDAIALARGYADRQLFDTRARSEALKSVIASQRGVQGRKVLVLLT